MADPENPFGGKKNTTVILAEVTGQVKRRNVRRASSVDRRDVSIPTTT